MKKITLIFALLTITPTYTIFDFGENKKAENWIIVDDVVMGGRSSGNFYINENGHGVFEGNVSLENNGGFSSLRYQFNRVSTQPYSKIVLRVKGDAKRYQFRIKNNTSDYYSYISYFMAPEQWETIEIPMNNMYPTFRGRKLNMPDFSGNSIEEIAFLIGNKKNESFKLEIDHILLK
ncbi:CIA30 family protein [Ascidiimonas aurantiaca]|uniref:CIA30 family protein n=1 Tax=Ascidiimonas aurantiaca TaxID=1685432 RepID=UPI0030ECBD5F